MRRTRVRFISTLFIPILQGFESNEIQSMGLQIIAISKAMLGLLKRGNDYSNRQST